jgi:hypothetical protein
LLTATVRYLGMAGKNVKPRTLYTNLLNLKKVVNERNKGMWG